MAGGRVSRAGWASQPQYPVQIDWENPDTRDLRFFYTGSMPVDLVTGQTATIVGGAAPRTVNAGQGAAIGPDISGSSYLDFGTRESWNVTGALSVFWRGLFTTVAGGVFRNVACKALTDASRNSPFDIYLDQGTGRVVIGQSNATDYRLHENATALSANSVSTIAITAAGDIAIPPFVWVNAGQRETSTLVGVGGGSGPATGTTESLRIGRRPDNATQMAGPVEVFCIWGRAIDDAQYRRLRSNPYSLLKSVRRRTGIIYGAGGAAFNPAWARGSNQLIGSGLHVS